MKKHRMTLALVGAFAFWAAGSHQVHASEVLYQGVGFMSGTQTITDSFTLPTAGTLTVTLSNIAWPQQLASLSMLLTSAGGALGPVMGPGTSTFNVASGNITAQLFGTAQGALNAGVYAMEIQFQPGAPVPLPTSIALLFSGLGLLLWQRRTHQEIPAQERLESQGGRST